MVARRGRRQRRLRLQVEGRMARVPIEMPKLGYDMEAGKVGSWLKKVGDSIARGEVIAEIETDKSTVDMEATASGTLAEIVHGPGDEVPVGEAIAYLDDGS
jgi:pyruvate dehydrogenase E2 component (dihydrolipoamide acetyltransferase)